MVLITGPNLLNPDQSERSQEQAKMRKKLLGLAALLVAGATASYADTITLVGPIPSHTYQQGTNSPCVIGNSSYQNPPNFGYTEIKANPGSYNMVPSPIYTVSQL